MRTLVSERVCKSGWKGERLTGGFRMTLTKGTSNQGFSQIQHLLGVYLHRWIYLAFTMNHRCLQTFSTRVTNLQRVSCKVDTTHKPIYCWTPSSLKRIFPTHKCQRLSKTSVNPHSGPISLVIKSTSIITISRTPICLTSSSSPNSIISSYIHRRLQERLNLSRYRWHLRS